MWHSGNESVQHPGCWFHPWPHSVGWASGTALSCGVGLGHSLDTMLLWLWCGLAAVAPIRPLAWERPHAMGAALKSNKKKKVIKDHLY